MANILNKANPVYIAVMGGVLSALFSLSSPYLSFFGIFLSYLSSFPLYCVALGWGWPHAVLAGVTATSLFFFSAGPQAALFYGLITVIPMLILSHLTLHKIIGVKGKTSWSPVGHAVSMLTFFIAAAIVLGCLWLYNQGLSPDSVLISWFAQAGEEASALTPAITTLVIQILPGIAGISWIIMACFNLWFAQKLLAKWGLSKRPFPTKQDKNLPEYWDIVFVACLLTMIIGDEQVDFVARNITILSFVPLFILGVSTLYEWFKRFENAHYWLIGYLIVTFFLVWPALVIVGLGVLEPSLHLRQRIRDEIKK